LTFLNASPQPSLHRFTCTNSPLFRIPELALSACIVFGRSLTHVNAEAVTFDLQKFAASVSDDARPLICNDHFEIISREPLTLLNRLTKRKRVIFPNGPARSTVTFKGTEYTDEKLKAQLRLSSEKVVTKRSETREKVRIKTVVDSGVSDIGSAVRSPATHAPALTGERTLPRGTRRPGTAPPRQAGRPTPPVDAGGEEEEEEEEELR
jgi:hypothetical protein